MTNIIQCRQCRIQKSCINCFEPSTFAPQTLASGVRSALCKLCFAKRQNKTPAQITSELHELAIELQSPTQ